MNDMKLLMESWRKFSVLAEQEENVGSIYLFENKTPVKKDFKILLEDFDNKKITEDELYECWSDSVLYEYTLLNEENILKRVGGAIKGTWKKFTNWIDTKIIQLWQMAQRGIKKTIAGAKVLIDKAADFKSEHPLVFKVTATVVLAIGMVALLSALAKANIVAPEFSDIPTPAGGIKGHGDEGVIGNNTYEALRGLVHYSGDDGIPLDLRSEAMKLIDASQAAGEAVDLTQLKGEIAEFANKELNVLNGLFKMARDGDQEAFEYIKQLVEVGKNATYKIQGIPTR